MAGSDLTVLIRMHRHELDERRRALSELYDAMTALEREVRALDQEVALETAAADASGIVNFTYAQYAESARQKKKALLQGMADLEKQIEAAKDRLVETFAEVKKYEMAQAQREKREAAAAAARETKTLDEIGLENFRRKESED